jgi:hypothetical protein
MEIFNDCLINNSIDMSLNDKKDQSIDTSSNSSTSSLPEVSFDKYKFNDRILQSLFTTIE